MEALDTPQLDTDELLRQIMGQASPDPNGNPEGAPAQVPMAPNSFGARIGSQAKQISAIPKPRPVPAEVAPPSPSAVAPPAAQPRLSNPIQMPPAPAALDPKAVDASGKSKYRMGIGQRIAGIAANAFNGFARNGAAPVYVGPGARNEQWQQDQDLNETNRKLYETATQGALRQGQIENYESRAATAGQRADTAENALKEKTTQFGETLKEKQREWDDKINELHNKPSRVVDDVADRKRIADEQGLKGEDRKFYILTGHLPKEFKPDGDKTRRGTPAQFANIEAKKKAALDAAEKEYSASTKGVQSFMPGAKETAQRNLEASKQRAQDAYESEIQALGGEITPQGAATAKPAAGGKLSTDDAKSYLTKAGWDGKTQPTPELKAKARQLAQKDGRGF